MAALSGGLSEDDEEAAQAHWNAQKDAIIEKIAAELKKKKEARLAREAAATAAEKQQRNAEASSSKQTLDKVIKLDDNEEETLRKQIKVEVVIPPQKRPVMGSSNICQRCYDYRYPCVVSPVTQ